MLEAYATSGDADYRLTRKLVRFFGRLISQLSNPLTNGSKPARSQSPWVGHYTFTNLI